MDKIKDNYIEQENIRSCYMCKNSGINEYEGRELFCYIDPELAVPIAYNGICDRFDQSNG